jgi:hypothetical protein
MARKGFRISNGKGFTITFDNGLTLSTQFGPGNYCENRNKYFDLEFSVRSIVAGEKGSKTAEIAVIGPDKEWMTEKVLGSGTDDVIGWINVSDWLEIVNKVANYKID